MGRHSDVVSANWNWWNQPRCHTDVTMFLLLLYFEREKFLSGKKNVKTSKTKSGKKYTMILYDDFV